MEKTPSGTSVGVDDPYAHVDRCDHLTDDGRCRYAFEHAHHDRPFADERREERYRCPVAIGEWEPRQCAHFRSRTDGHSCVRCGLEERLIRHGDERPLLEEHHLSYATGGEEIGHEITVSLCRWCHAKVHSSWARITDDVSPDPEALAAGEGRRDRERDEYDFPTAADRYSSENRRT